MEDKSPPRWGLGSWWCCCHGNAIGRCDCLKFDIDGVARGRCNSKATPISSLQILGNRLDFMVMVQCLLWTSNCHSSKNYNRIPKDVFFVRDIKFVAWLLAMAVWVSPYHHFVNCNKERIFRAVRAILNHIRWNFQHSNCKLLGYL